MSDEKEKLNKIKVQIQHEFLQTEEKYLKSLGIIADVYTKRLEESKVLPAKDIQTIFGNTSTLRYLHQSLYAQLLDSAGDPSAFGTSIANLIPFLKIYTEYINTYQAANSLLQTKRSNSKKLNALLDELHDLPECNKLGLEDYLIMPIQRLPRYELLLRDILRNTVEETEQTKFEELLKHFSEVNAYVNERKGDALKRERLVRLQNTIKPKVDIFSRPDRKLVKEGDLENVEGSKIGQKEGYFFLFDDFLLQVRPEKWNFRQLYNPLKLKLVEDENSDPNTLDFIEGDVTSGNESEQNGTKPENGVKKYGFKAKTEKERNEWKEAILSVQKKMLQDSLTGPFPKEEPPKVDNANVSGLRDTLQKTRRSLSNYGTTKTKAEKAMYDYDYMFKISVIGDGVGRELFLDNMTDMKMSQSLRLRTLEHGGKTIKLQVWDTQCDPLSDQALRGTQALIFVYDLMSNESFTALGKTLKGLKKKLKELSIPDSSPGLLLGHRYLSLQQDPGNDKVLPRQVPLEQSVALAEKYNFDCLDIGIGEEENNKLDAKLIRLIEGFIPKDDKKQKKASNSSITPAEKEKKDKKKKGTIKTKKKGKRESILVRVKSNSKPLKKKASMDYSDHDDPKRVAIAGTEIKDNEQDITIASPPPEIRSELSLSASKKIEKHPSSGLKVSDTRPRHATISSKQEILALALGKEAALAKKPVSIKSKSFSKSTDGDSDSPSPQEESYTLTEIRRAASSPLIESTPQAVVPDLPPKDSENNNNLQIPVVAHSTTELISPTGQRTVSASKLLFSSLSSSGNSSSNFARTITGLPGFDPMSIDPYSAPIEEVRKALFSLQREMKKLKNQQTSSSPQVNGSVTPETNNTQS